MDFVFDRPTGFLTVSQRRALCRLKNLMRLRSIHVRACGIRGRQAILIAGPSGSGKTALVERITQEEGLPLLTIASASWIPTGALDKNYSLTRVKEHVAKYSRGAIFLDEIDKISGEDARRTSWARGSWAEALALIDASSQLATLGFSNPEIVSLRNNFTLIAAGAWQEAAIATRTDPHGDSYAERVRNNPGIEEEVFLRFCPPIFIEPPTQGDYVEGLRLLRKELKLPALSGREVVRLAEEALESRSGFRWLEDYLTNLAVRQPELFPRKACEAADGDPFTPMPRAKDERRTISRTDWKGIQEKMMALIQKLPEPLLGLEQALLRERALIAVYPDTIDIIVSGEKLGAGDVGLLEALSAVRDPLHHFAYATSIAQTRLHEGPLWEGLTWILTRTCQLLDQYPEEMETMKLTGVLIPVQARVKRIVGLWNRLTAAEVVEG